MVPFWYYSIARSEGFPHKVKLLGWATFFFPRPKPEALLKCHKSLVGPQIHYMVKSIGTPRYYTNRDFNEIAQKYLQTLIWG